MYTRCDYPREIGNGSAGLHRGNGYRRAATLPRVYLGQEADWVQEEDGKASVWMVGNDGCSGKERRLWVEAGPCHADLDGDCFAGRWGAGFEVGAEAGLSDGFTQLVDCRPVGKCTVELVEFGGYSGLTWLFGVVDPKSSAAKNDYSTRNINRKL